MCQRKEFIETLKLEEDEWVCLDDNKATKVPGVGIITLKIFNDHEFLLYNGREVLQLEKKSVSISMFNVIVYSTRVEYGVFMISDDGMNVAKVYKICSLYILEDFTFVVQSSSSSEYFYSKTKLGDLMHFAWDKG